MADNDIFFFLSFFFLISHFRYSSFCSNTDVNYTTQLGTKIYHKIKKILGNIKVMLLKLDTSGKQTPIMMLPWHCSGQRHNRCHFAS